MGISSQAKQKLDHYLSVKQIVSKYLQLEEVSILLLIIIIHQMIFQTSLAVLNTLR